MNVAYQLVTAVEHVSHCTLELIWHRPQRKDCGGTPCIVHIRGDRKKRSWKIRGRGSRSGLATLLGQRKNKAWGDPVTTPLDTDALLCVDKETRSEWDALNPFVAHLNKNAISSDLAKSVLPNTHVRTLRSTQGGLPHEEASALVSTASCAGASAAAGGASGPRMDPTQQSFVDHMCAWRDAYVNAADGCQSNLPLPLDRDGPWQLCSPVLLLGTAGTGKTTTMQAANQQLETHV